VTFFITPRFEIKLELLFGKHVKFTKKRRILSPYTENVYNLAQKLDNSIQIVKITDHV